MTLLYQNNKLDQQKSQSTPSMIRLQYLTPNTLKYKPNKTMFQRKHVTISAKNK